MPASNATITAINGIVVGHVTDTTHLTGVTVIRFGSEGARAAVSVQGAAPGTRETDLLEPGNLVEKVHALVLSGGSAYVLDAATGVMAALESEGIGLPVFDGVVVPIVPAAVLFDLQVGSSAVRPSDGWGRLAAEEANSQPVLSGNVGAGTGATVGKLLGPSSVTKGGLGNALIELDSGIKVSALVAVNAVGEVVDSSTGETIAGVRSEKRGNYESAVDIALNSQSAKPLIGTNTTIGVVVTNAQLTTTQLRKIANMAHDGLARAVRPVHTQFDGDTMFAMSMPDSVQSGESVAESLLNTVGIAAAKVMELAIIDAVKSAESIGGVVASCDWAKK